MMTQPLNMTNKQVTKKEFHSELIDYLIYCPRDEREVVMKFLKKLYSINMHTLFMGDAVDVVRDSIDITDNNVDNVNLVNFLMTSQIRIRVRFGDINNLVGDHLKILGEMMLSVGVHTSDTTPRNGSTILNYIMLIRIYLDLDLFAIIEDRTRDDSL